MWTLKFALVRIWISTIKDHQIQSNVWPELFLQWQVSSLLQMLFANLMVPPQVSKPVRERKMWREEQTGRGWEVERYWQTCRDSKRGRYAKRLRQSQGGGGGGKREGGSKREHEAGNSSSAEHTIAEWSCEAGCARLLRTLLFVCWLSCANGKPSEASAASLCAEIGSGSDVARLPLQNFAGSHAKAVTALSLTCSLPHLEGECKEIRGGLFGPQLRLTATPAAWGF